jgi:hypothetical protein
VVDRLLHELYHALPNVRSHQCPYSDQFSGMLQSRFVVFFRPVVTVSILCISSPPLIMHACGIFWMGNAGWNDCAMILSITRPTDHLQQQQQQDGRDIQPESSVAPLDLDSCHVTTPYAYLVGYQASGFEAGLTTAIRLRPQQCRRLFIAVCFTRPAFAALCSILVTNVLPLQKRIYYSLSVVVP